MPRPPAPPVFETFGCRLNAYETEAMKALAAEQGLGDAVVVNTCAVTAEAVRQARQRIRKLRASGRRRIARRSGSAAPQPVGRMVTSPAWSRSAS